MAATWRFALFLCMFLMLTLRPSLASDGTKRSVTASSDRSSGLSTKTTPDSGHGSTSDSGHNTTGDAGGGGHEPAAITTLPIVTWKWHHVEQPYLVALWILVSWLCKLSES
ncbi:hypothetical protein L3Q82_003124 [Scortum barcoo]|uniref:Uncharacterized protein n=1 Tax=Scortum barcoo TaxID=214431 RepID=A0ACB8VRI9_9TELE|nr:hypothetical protein L3Q82_003124 [Scortum barcoo]